RLFAFRTEPLAECCYLNGVLHRKIRFDPGRDFEATGSGQYGMFRAAREFIVGSAFEPPARFRLANSSPLLKEKRNSVIPALVSHGDHPLFFHRPCTAPALSTNN